MPPVEVMCVSPTSDLATGLLQRYYAELDHRFAGGFDVDQTVAAPEEELVAPHGVFLVARVGGGPVGCGAVRKLDGATAEVKRMWIDPAVRGRGVGRSLLTALEAAARELGCRVVRLDTSADLTEALGLYRSAGYCEIPAYNDNKYAAHWFQKVLS